MKKTLFIYMLFMGSLVACTQSTDDSKTDDSLGPDHEEYPVGTGEGRDSGSEQDTTRNNLNNQGVIDGDTVTMPAGTGENI